MKPNFSLLSLLVFAGALVLSSFNNAEPQKKMKSADDALIKKGEYLVGVLGCGDCHAPKIMTPQGPVPDPALGLSGHPSSVPMPKVNKEALKDWTLFFPTLTLAVGPWGATFAANITPDDTGIGSWSYEQFKIAMTQGKSKGIPTARPLLPPMPWQNYVHMKDEDLRDFYGLSKRISISFVIFLVLTYYCISSLYQLIANSVKNRHLILPFSYFSLIVIPQLSL